MLPLLKTALAKPGARRARVVCIGTGGGVLSPSPPLISAYMASKWSVEAYVQSLRFEMQLRKLRIDACMLNPGVVKPTALAAGGFNLIERMWAQCKAGAKEEYGALLEQLVAHQASEPGTHVSKVAERMEHIMAAGVPRSTNLVGPDSNATPWVGMLPTGVRELIIKLAVFKRVDSV
jgi:NAD(P)-dependent dehydrogenase (short-subunit alcohol dehydrogenase family)